MTTTRYAPQTVTIANGRPHAAEFSLDRSGFTLLGHESAVTDFGDPRQLDTTYTAEALDLVKRVTGADEAVALGWVIRRSAPEGQELDGAQPPAPDVHVDIHPGRAHVRMEAASPRRGEPYKRAIVTSLWRAFSPPPQDWPLALLDYRSVSDDEGVVNLLLFVESLPDPGDVPDVEDPDSGRPGASSSTGRGTAGGTSRRCARVRSCCSSCTTPITRWRGGRRTRPSMMLRRPALSPGRALSCGVSPTSTDSPGCAGSAARARPAETGSAVARAAGCPGSPSQCRASPAGRGG